MIIVDIIIKAAIMAMFQDFFKNGIINASLNGPEGATQLART